MRCAARGRRASPAGAVAPRVGTRLGPMPPSDQTDPSETEQHVTFADLGLDDAGAARRCADVGYETPSPIQAATIPPLLEGRDVVGLAQTGTGKTAAFALPILSRLDLQAEDAAGAGARARPASSRSRSARPSSGTPRTCPGVHVLPDLRRPGVRRPAVAPCAAACTSSSAPRAGSWTTSRRAPSTCPSCASWCSTRPTRCSRWASPRTSRRSSPTPRTDKHVALFSATMPRADPPDLEEVPQRPGRDHRQEQDRRRRPTPPSAT